MSGKLSFTERPQNQYFQLWGHRGLVTTAELSINSAGVNGKQPQAASRASP